ncbi:MAG: hypothetical protein WDN31_09075 [Hyphomicrobium sp.]
MPTRDESVSLKGFDRPIGFVRVLAKACRGVTTGIVVLSGPAYDESDRGDGYKK